MKELISTYTDKDDAIHPFDTPYSYEWWYFDGQFENGYTFTASCFWRAIVMGNPAPFIMMSIYTPDGKKLDGAQVFDYSNAKTSPDKCEATIDKNYVRQEGDTYKISLHAAQIGTHMGVEMTLKRRGPGWKWSESGLLLDDENGKQGWVCPVPMGDAEGKLFLDGKEIQVKGKGYHDHNWGDTLMSKSMMGWVWGRMFHPEYTFVYFDLLPIAKETGINTAMFIMKNGKPLFACTPIKYTLGKDVLHKGTGKSIPTDILIEGSSNGVDVRCHLDVVEVLHSSTNPPDEAGFITNYYRRLNKYDAKITVDGKTVTVTGEAINEHVLLR